MKKFERFEAFVQFQGQFLRVEEIGGVKTSLIVFNPDYNENRPNYKIQLIEKRKF